MSKRNETRYNEAFAMIRQGTSSIPKSNNLSGSSQNTQDNTITQASAYTPSTEEAQIEAAATRTNEGGEWSGLKAYETDAGEFMAFGCYPTRGAAKADAANLFDEDFTDARVYRVPWLDGMDCGGFEDDCHPDVMMATLRHGGSWTICDDHGNIEVIDPDDLRTESDWKALADHIGAKYPDHYKPKKES